MNGFSTEEETRGTGHNQICCLIDGAHRCSRPAGNASYSKRIQKTVQQRRLRLIRDDSVGLQCFISCRRAQTHPQKTKKNTGLVISHFNARY